LFEAEGLDPGHKIICMLFVGHDDRRSVRMAWRGACLLACVVTQVLALPIGASPDLLFYASNWFSWWSR
jgi:hypothetical protein